MKTISRIKKTYLGKVAIDESNPISSPKKWIRIRKHEYETMILDSGKLLFDIDFYIIL